jgi:hypothetical protein
MGCEWSIRAEQDKIRSTSPDYLMLPLCDWAAGEFRPVSSSGVLGFSEKRADVFLPFKTPKVG